MVWRCVKVCVVCRVCSLALVINDVIRARYSSKQNWVIWIMVNHHPLFFSSSCLYELLMTHEPILLTALTLFLVCPPHDQTTRNTVIPSDLLTVLNLLSLSECCIVCNAYVLCSVEAVALPHGSMFNFKKAQKMEVVKGWCVYSNSAKHFL